MVFGNTMYGDVAGTYVDRSVDRVCVLLVGVSRDGLVNGSALLAG